MSKRFTPQLWLFTPIISFIVIMVWGMITRFDGQAAIVIFPFTISLVLSFPILLVIGVVCHFSKKYEGGKIIILATLIQFAVVMTFFRFFGNLPLH